MRLIGTHNQQQQEFLQTQPITARLATLASLIETYEKEKDSKIRVLVRGKKGLGVLKPSYVPLTLCSFF